MNDIVTLLKVIDWCKSYLSK